MKSNVPTARLLPVALVAALSTGVFAQTNGRLAAVPSGFPEQPVEVIRDTFGVPHIFAATLADAVFGQAVCHAEDNLPQVLDNLAAARGQSARVAGRNRLEADLMVRVFKLSELVRQTYDALAPGHRAIADAYAAGLNGYLADHPDKRPAWLESVTGPDVIAMTKLRQLQEALSSAQADLSGASQAGPDDQGGASNMWALRPSRTTDGSVILVSDPHLAWDGATKWHEAHLIVGGRWIYGVTFAGSPGVGIGFTQDIAWGMTNNGADLGDVYRVSLDPKNPDRYRYAGGWRDITTRTFTIEVREADGSVRKVERTVRFTHHGPILRENEAAHEAFAARLAGFDQPVSMLGWIGNFNARNLTELEAVFDSAHVNKWNCIAADRHGDIGYYYFAAAHQRTDDFRWNAPVDGSLGATEWGPALTWRDLPHTRNPASGYLQNCNNNSFTITRDCPLQPQNFPKHLMSQGTTLSPGTRAHRATELIEARPKHNVASIKAAALDIKALTAQPLLDLILDADKKAGATVPDPGGQRKQAVTALKSWDGLATTDNRALPILAAFREATQKETAPTNRKTRKGAARKQSGAAALLLPPEVLASLDAALKLLRERFGDGPITWGRMHLIQRGGTSLPMPGAGSDRGADPFTCLFMAGAKKQTDGKFPCDSGSSWMQFVVFRDGKVSAETILPFGNSNDPASPHYADQMPLFARRELKQALLTRPEIEAAASSRKILTR